jgi:hypothetical protein
MGPKLALSANRHSSHSFIVSFLDDGSHHHYTKWNDERHREKAGRLSTSKDEKYPYPYLLRSNGDRKKPRAVGGNDSGLAFYLLNVTM